MKHLRALVGMVALGSAGCGESRAPESPTSPTAAVGSAVGDTSGLTPMKITAPSPVSPADGVRLDTGQPTLVVSNPTAAHSPSAVLMVRFLIQDQAGATVHESAPVGLGAGTTQYTVPLELPHDQAYRWSAAVVWNDTPGASSAVRSFTTPVPPEPPPPAIETCPGSDPLSIVVCQRERTPGFMDDGELLDFMVRLAHNLNANGVGGGPYGVLRKAAGKNCGGYSCDIICAGQGGGQRQWDVLRDTEGPQVPLWAGPHDGGDIRVDVCEIQ